VRCNADSLIAVVALEDLRCAVGRSVVYRYDRRVKRARKHYLDHFLEGVLLIVDRDDHVECHGRLLPTARCLATAAAIQATAAAARIVMMGSMGILARSDPWKISERSTCVATTT